MMLIKISVLFRANFKVARLLLLRPQRTIVIAGGRAAVNQKSGAGYERALAAHQQLRHIGHLSLFTMAGVWEDRPMCRTTPSSFSFWMWARAPE